MHIISKFFCVFLLTFLFVCVIILITKEHRQKTFVNVNNYVCWFLFIFTMCILYVVLDFILSTLCTDCYSLYGYWNPLYNSFKFSTFHKLLLAIWVLKQKKKVKYTNTPKLLLAIWVLKQIYVCAQNVLVTLDCYSLYGYWN